MSDAGDADDEDIEAIKERKKEELLSGSGLAEPVHVESADHLSEIVADESVVLVDFHADWCGPCQMLEPVLGAIAEETAATVAKVDVDDHQELAAEHEVQSIPTMLLYADGAQVERLVGMQDQETLFRLVDEHL